MPARVLRTPTKKNAEVARLLYEIGEILDVQQVAFKPQAYQRAARNIEALGEDLEDVARRGDLAKIPGVGANISQKIQEYLGTGRIRALEELREQVPPVVLALMRIPGIGPKSALRLQKDLGVASLAELENAARAGRIRTLKGFGERKEMEILGALTRTRKAPASTRIPYPQALALASALLRHLRGHGASRADAAGSLRRGRDTVGDVDLLASAPPGAAPRLIDAFTTHPEVVRVIERGATRARVVVAGPVQVDLRVVEEASYGAALLYFTGSKEHNIALRARALKKGWTVNEYALTRKRDGRVLAGRTEEEVYARLGLAFVPPELRENRGELEAAQSDKLPRLVALDDIRGDLHTHTRESDGTAPLEDMVAEAEALGYDWYGVTDHTQGLGIARGLTPARFAAQRRAMARAQRRFPGVRLFQGAEVNIRKDGRLDLEAKALAALDFVVASVHGSFRLGLREQTDRVVRAFEQGVDILAHPTTRLLGDRDPIDLDWDRVYREAHRCNVALEINASPFRLDFPGERVQAARSAGCSFAVNTDAHTTSGLRAMGFGVTQARRGGLEAKHVVNTRSAADLEKLWAKRRG